MERNPIQAEPKGTSPEKGQNSPQACQLLIEENLPNRRTRFTNLFTKEELKIRFRYSWLYGSWRSAQKKEEALWDHKALDKYLKVRSKPHTFSAKWLPKAFTK